MMAITVDPRTEHDLTLMTREYEKHGKHVTPAFLVEEIIHILRDIVYAEQRSESRSNLTDEERAILREGGFDLERHTDAPDPRLRTQIKYAAIIADAYTAREAAGVLGVTTSRIRQMLGARTLYGIKWKSEWRVPRFQFDGDHLVPHVDRIIPRLDPAQDTIGIFNWFTLPNDDLRDTAYREMSPRAWLIAGRNWEPVAEQVASL